MIMNKSLIPKEAKRIPLRPLAWGEKTFHHHSLVMDPESTVALEEAAEMYELEAEGGPKVFLRITEEGVSLQHAEHKTQPVPPGDYAVTIQQEATDWGSSRVAD